MSIAASGSSQAAIANTGLHPDATSPELSLTIWDPIGKASYALDLGMTMNEAFTLGQDDDGLQKFWIIDKALDVPFNKLRQLGTAVSSLQWAVFAADTGGFGDPGDYKLATTLRPTATSGVVGADYDRLTKLTNIDFETTKSQFDGYITALNSANNTSNLHGRFGAGGASDNIGFDGSSFTTEGQEDYYATFTLQTMGATGINLTNAVGTSSWFYQVQQSGYEISDPVTVDEYDNLSHDAYWGLAENPADGTFVLSYTMRSALPTASQLAFARTIGRTEYSGGFMSNPLAGAAAASVDDRAYAAGFSRPLGAVSPVPEPSTWALLAGGLALVGAAARRRRARHG